MVYLEIKLKKSKNYNRFNILLFQIFIFFYFPYSINNNINDTQYLNNFINVEITNLRYLSFASYSNGDMILNTWKYPNSNFRAFLGFKRNGRSFFLNNETNESNYYYSIELEQSDNYIKYEGNNLLIKLSGREKNENEEYLLSISKENSYVEIYDFKNYKIYKKLIYDFTDIKYITSQQNMAISLFSNSSDYYYLFGFVGSNNTHENIFYIQKHIFKSLESFENNKTKEISKIVTQTISNKQTGYSCFQTEKQIIMCFFLTIEQKYIINAYDLDLNLKKSITLPDTKLHFEQTFYKCFHLKSEIGVFSYFEFFEGKNPDYFPVIIFKEFYENTTGINIIDYKIQKIIIDKINTLYDPFILLNDLIKIDNNKLCFVSTNKNGKNKLYIILINLFREKYYKVRYYIIDLLSLYGYSVHMELEAHKYNNFISLAFSFKNDYIEKCDNYSNFWKTCVTLLIFSYPNSTDNDFILDNYLYNNLTQNYIEYNLEEKTRIENNIFGYEFLGIKIKDLINCEYLFIITNFHKKSIYSNYNLTKNESIKFKLNANCNEYNAFICNLQYAYKISESNLTEYDNYPNIIDGFNETELSDFQKEEYIGRLTYFNIILQKNLTTKCNDENCILCELNKTDHCLEYKYNFNYSEKEEKICFDNYIGTDFINSDFIINNFSENIDSNSLYSDTIIMSGNIEIIKREIKENKDN